MIKRKDELTHLLNENMKGGNGTVEVIRVLDPGEYESGIKMIAKLILNPGCSLGYHEHHGEEELVHILAGRADYLEDGEAKQLFTGDSAVCLSGHGHSLICPEDAEEPLIVYAVITAI